MLYDLAVSAEQLRAAALWAEPGERMGTVELLADDSMLVAEQGDERAAWDVGGEPGSDEYLSKAPLIEKVTYPLAPDETKRVLGVVLGHVERLRTFAGSTHVGEASSRAIAATEADELEQLADKLTTYTAALEGGARRG